MADKIEKNGLGWKMWFGIGASFVYAVVAGCLLYHNQKYSEHLKLSEVGDYLAGAFSPLAFLWLVTGYLMQNKELKEQSFQFRKNLNFQIDLNKKRELESTNKIQPVFLVIFNDEEKNSTKALSELFSSRILSNDFEFDQKLKEFIDKNESLKIELLITSLKNEAYDVEFKSPPTFKIGNSKKLITLERIHIIEKGVESSFHINLNENDIKKIFDGEKLVPMFFEDQNRKKQSTNLRIVYNPFRQEPKFSIDSTIKKELGNDN